MIGVVNVSDFISKRLKIKNEIHTCILSIKVLLHHIGFLKKRFAWKTIGISLSCQNLDLSLSFLVCPTRTCKNRTLKIGQQIMPVRPN